jgi:parvulin-like peptidyl-prolyl isomerase
MKRKVAPWMAGFLVVMIAMVSVTCKKGSDKAGTTKEPAEQEKIAKQRLESIQESKKVVAAKVNGAVITLRDLIERMNQVAPKYAKSPKEMTPEIDQKVRNEALDILIFRELAIQEAVKQGMKVPTERVYEILKQVKANTGSEEAFKKSLEMEAKTEESLRREIERNALFDMIAEKEIYSRVRVDEKRLREAYEKNKNKYSSPETLDVEDVVILKRGDDAAMMSKAKDILSQIKKNNNDFSKLPQDGTFLVRQGTISREEYPHLFEASVRLNPGSLSDVIREDDGLHIIKVTGRHPARQLTFEEARTLVEKEWRISLSEKRKQEWEATLKKNAKIEMPTAKELSEIELAR